MSCQKLHINEEFYKQNNITLSPLKQTFSSSKNNVCNCKPFIKTCTWSYRFSFQGQETDNEIKGNGNQIDYGFRVYDPRIAKFLSVDPLTKSFPMLTPYQYASNTPIACIDLDGLEAMISIHNEQSGKTTYEYNEDPNSAFSFSTNATEHLNYIPKPVLETITDLDAVSIVYDENGDFNYTITKGADVRLDKRTGKLYKEYNERTRMGKVFVQGKKVFNKPTLFLTTIVNGTIGNITEEITGKYPDWAYTYKWNDRGQFEKQKDMFLTPSDDDAKEMIGATVGTYLMGLKIVTTPKKIINVLGDQASKALINMGVKKGLENVPEVDNQNQQESTTEDDQD